MTGQNQLNRVGARIAARNLAYATERIRIDTVTVDAFGAVDPVTGQPTETVVTVETDAPAIVVSTARGSSADTARTVTDQAWHDLDTITVRCAPGITRPEPGDRVTILSSTDPNLEGRSAIVLGTLLPARWYTRFVAELESTR